jgi:hypothetical protein
MTSQLKPAVQLLVDSNLLSKDTLAQFVRWKLLPKEVLSQQKDGTHPPSSSSWEDAETFVEALEDALDTERETIRETNLTDGLRHVQVWLKWSTGRFDKKPREVLVDQLSRLYIPQSLMGNGKPRTVVAVAFEPNVKLARKVRTTEARFENQQRTTTVLVLEDESHEAL